MTIIVFGILLIRILLNALFVRISLYGGEKDG